MGMKVSLRAQTLDVVIFSFSETIESATEAAHKALTDLGSGRVAVRMT